MSNNIAVLRVVRARGLKAMDSGGMFGGKKSSDPYCAVVLGDVRLKTAVVKKSLAPEWDYAAEVETDDPSASVAFEVYDYDLVGADDLIGVVTVRVADMAAAPGAATAWHALSASAGAAPDAAKLGEVELDCAWVHSAAVAARTALPIEEEAAYAAENGGADPAPLKAGLALNELRVVLVRARRLKVMDKHMFAKGGTSDPLVTMALPPPPPAAAAAKQAKATVRKSTVVKGTVAPVWKERFSFPLAEAAAAADGEAPSPAVSALRVTVDDYDTVGGNDFMGVAVLDLSGLGDRRPSRAWNPLRDDEAGATAGGDRGDVELYVRWVHNPELVPKADGAVAIEEDAVPADPRPGTAAAPLNELKVVLVQCRGLLAVDANLFGAKTSDPQVVFTVAGQAPAKPSKASQKSTSKKATCAPVYKERFALPIDAASGPPGAHLHVLVQDYDLIGDADFMGGVAVPLADLRPGAPVRAWYPLEDASGCVDSTRGEVELWLRWVHSAERATEAACHLDEERTDPLREGEKPREHDGSDPNPDLPPNQVDVVVIRATRLPVMDAALFGKGSSDPQVKLKVGSHAFTSTAKKGTLEPLWLERFSVPADPGDAAAAALELEVQDYDIVGDADFMGRASLDLAALRESRAPLRTWLQLQGEPDDGGGESANRGAIEVWCRCVHNPRLVADDGLELDEEIAERAAAEAADAGETAPPPDVNADKPPNCLRVVLVRAKRLPVMDRSMFGGKNSGSSDPVVTIKCGKEVRKSAVVKGCLAPEYLERYDIPLEDSALKVELTVDDWDQVGSNDFMGRAFVAVGPLSDKAPVRRWHRLGDKKGVVEEKRERGELDVRLQWCYEPALDPDSQIPLPEEAADDDESLVMPSNKRPNEVRIVLVRARRLPPMDKSMLGRGAGTSDPLVVLQIGKAEQKSTTKQKSLNPVWLERFNFPCETPAAKLVLRVDDEDKLSSNDTMGRLTLPLKKLWSKKPMRRWFTLCDKHGEPDAALGDVEVYMRWVHNPALGDDVAAPFGDDAIVNSDHPDKAPNELNVYVVRAKNLLAVDKSNFGRGASSDPYVVVEVGKEKRKTNAKKRDLNPIWKHKFKLPAADPALRCLVSVYDKDLASGDDVIGYTSIPMLPLQSKTTVSRWFTLRATKDPPAKPYAGPHLGEVQLAFKWGYNPALVAGGREKPRVLGKPMGTATRLDAPDIPPMARVGPLDDPPEWFYVGSPRAEQIAADAEAKRIAEGDGGEMNDYDDAPTAGGASVASTGTGTGTDAPVKAADRQPEARGPFRLPELKAMWDTRKIHGSTLLWKEGMGAWDPVNDVAEIKQYVKRTLL